MKYINSPIIITESLALPEQAVQTCWAAAVVAVELFAVAGVAGAESSAASTAEEWLQSLSYQPQSNPSLGPVVGRR